MGSAPTPATRRVSGPVPSPPSGRPSRHHGNRPRGLVEENPCGFAPPRAGARAHHDRRGTGGVVEQGLNRGEQNDVFEHRHLPVLLPPRTQHVRQELHLLASQVARSFSGTAKGHSAAQEGFRPRYPGHPTRPPPLSDPSARGTRRPSPSCQTTALDPASRPAVTKIRSVRGEPSGVVRRTAAILRPVVPPGTVAMRGTSFRTTARTDCRSARRRANTSLAAWAVTSPATVPPTTTTARTASTIQPPRCRRGAAADCPASATAALSCTRPWASVRPSSSYG